MKLCITGGTGTLGQALARHFSWADRIVILSRDEQKQAAMAEAFNTPSNMRFFLGDVRDHDRLVDAFYGCDAVIHTAALKRVDSIAYNPMEVRKTNIQGSANVLSAAMASQVRRVLMISSDKACEPTNVYGVSKAAMEHEAVAFNALSVPRGLRVACARYGNVLGSRGSVVHTWRRAVAEGRPIPLTSTEATRFWLTVEQAVGVVETALNYMQGGEIFVPDLWAMSMVDLAEAIAPGMEVKLIGMRPGGEKLHETLITGEEAPRTIKVGAGNESLWAITPHLHPWRESPWQGPRYPLPYRPLTSDTVPRFRVEEMRTMLKDVS